MIIKFLFIFVKDILIKQYPVQTKNQNNAIIFFYFQKKISEVIRFNNNMDNIMENFITIFS